MKYTQLHYIDCLKVQIPTSSVLTWTWYPQESARGCVPESNSFFTNTNAKFFFLQKLARCIENWPGPYTQPQNRKACVGYAPTLLLHRWLEDPFLGEIIRQDGQDYIFGRGAIDDKHSVVDFLYFFLFPLPTFSLVTTTTQLMSHIHHFGGKKNIC